jgi:endonuclease/exonuclease/phosphatase family metal-dependent hydrolase
LWRGGTLKNQKILIIFLFIVFSGFYSFESNAKEIKLLTLNTFSLPQPIFKFRGRSIEQLKPLKNILKKYDVVFLQEVFSKSVRRFISTTDFKYQYFGKYSKINSLFDLLFKRDLGDGLVILSRYPIIDKDILEYTEGRVSGKKTKRCAGTDCWARKSVQFARIQIHENLTIDLYNTHLNSGGQDGQEIRLSQINQINDFVLRHSKDTPAVLGGDFNSKPGTLAYKKLLSASKGFKRLDLWNLYTSLNPNLSDKEKAGHTSAPAENTWKIKKGVKRGGRRVDLLLFQNGQHPSNVILKLSDMKVALKQKFNGNHISDHFGVEATLSIQ